LRRLCWARSWASSRASSRCQAAVGLELLELLQVSLQGAVDALLVDGQELELIRLGLERSGVRESDLDFPVLALMAEREHIVLDGAGAPTIGTVPRQQITGIRPGRYIKVTTPVALGDGVGELLFHGSFGFEAVDELVAEAVVRFAVLGGEDVDLASVAVTEVVQAGARFPGGGGWASGTLGVSAVGFELLFGDHRMQFPSWLK
jgi:hypothetical protein